MDEATIAGLPKIFKDNIKTLKRISLDDSSGKSMCSSEVRAIYFDAYSQDYAKRRHLSSMPKSNDGLYVKDGVWHFVEFKNGSIDKYALYRKIYDSLVMLIDDGVIDGVEDARKKVTYTLVYNSEKVQNVNEYSKALKKHADYLSGLAKREVQLYDIGSLEGYLFKETHTYTTEQFQEKFLRDKT